MKKSKRNIIIIVILVIILLISGYVLIKYNNINKNVVDNYINNEIVPPFSEEQGLGEEKINTSEKLKQEKTFEGLLFTNISIVQFNKLCTFEADIINYSGKDTHAIERDAIILNEQNEEIGRIPIYIDSMKKDGKTHIYTSTEENILPAMDFKIVNKK